MPAMDRLDITVHRTSIKVEGNDHLLVFTTEKLSLPAQDHLKAAARNFRNAVLDIPQLPHVFAICIGPEVEIEKLADGPSE